MKSFKKKSPFSGTALIERVDIKHRDQAKI